VPVTPRAKRALELASTAAVHLGRDSVYPEHILLGLLFDRNDVAARILIDCDADLDQIRSESLSVNRI
jgi:ATP-dependent Clp protease ATP-binding subunit ClpC